EEVNEVDEVAFQNLRNYDENPQGIKLPEDQVFAYDDDGNVYLVVTLVEPGNPRNIEAFTLYKVDLNPRRLHRSVEDSRTETQTVAGYGYLPEFLAMGSFSGED
ncbi:MAG: hypothetical protein O3B72_05445, partial [Proteobacteria bacterium]|nr:hypothetical protein [Pseudomonadota bacterium]